MISPIHVSGTPENESVQSFDVRMYFPKEMARDDIIDAVMTALGISEICEIVAAYEMVSDGFGRLVPAEDGLLA